MTIEDARLTPQQMLDRLSAAMREHRRQFGDTMKTEAEIASFARELNALLSAHGLAITQASGPAIWLQEAPGVVHDYRFFARSGVESAWVICEPWEG